MLRDLLRGNSKPDNAIDESHTRDVVDNQRVVKKKRDSKKLLLSLLLFGLCACLGFVTISYMVNSGGKTLHLSPRKALGLPQGRQIALATVGQPQPGGIGVATATAIAAVPASAAPPTPSPVVGPVPEKQTASSGMSQKRQGVNKVLEGRDVFKEFYVKQAGDVSEMKRILEKGVPGIGKPDERLLQALGQPTVAPPVEQPKEIKIFGTTCIGDGDCIAITSEGVLKRGDMVGDSGETVNHVSGTFLGTNRRVVSW